MMAACGFLPSSVTWIISNAHKTRTLALAPHPSPSESPAPFGWKENEPLPHDPANEAKLRTYDGHDVLQRPAETHAVDIVCELYAEHARLEQQLPPLAVLKVPAPLRKQKEKKVSELPK